MQMPDPSRVADVIELWAWGNSQSFTQSDLASWIETNYGDNLLGYTDADFDTSEDDEPYELLATQVFDEVLSRTAILGHAYPFSSNGNRIRYSGPATSRSSYIFCLLLSYLPAQQITNTQRGVQFETLAMTAAQSFFGGEGMRIGFPWETSTYNDLLDQILVALPNLRSVALDEPVTAGDRGWDILIVKGFADSEYPRFVALGNCATGRHDWLGKGFDAPPSYLWSCFRSQQPGVQITFSAVPFFMDDDSRRRKVTESHMTFDRYRLCEFAPEVDIATATWMNTQRAVATTLNIDQ